MRTNARSLPAAAAALLLAASAAVVSGCGNPKSEENSPGGPKAPAGNPKLYAPAVIGVVTFEAPATTAQMTVVPPNPDPKLIRLSVQAGETAAWWTPASSTAANTVQIVPNSWKPMMPFVNTPSYQNGFLVSGPLKPQAANHGSGTDCKDNSGNVGQCYEYMAVLVVPDGPPKQIDPRIQIMP